MCHEPSLGRQRVPGRPRPVEIRPAGTGAGGALQSSCSRAQSQKPIGIHTGVLLDVRLSAACPLCEMGGLGVLLSVAARFVRSLAWRLGLSAGAGALVLAAGGAAPSYAAPFVWSGGAPPGQGQWSKPANWAGGVAPSGTVEQLSFPAPTSAACNVTPPSQPTLTCLQGTNDLSGLRTESLSIDNGYAYDLTGEPLTLGAGGCTGARSNCLLYTYEADD